MSPRAAIPMKPAAAKARTLTHAPGNLLQRKCDCGASSGQESECQDCKKKKVQRRATAPGPGTVPAIVHDVLGSAGQPLDRQTRSFFEPRLGHDFSKVRVHTDAKAAESARSVQALAYTSGQDLVFGSGQFAPDTKTGQKLLAHELTHVVQQSRRQHGASEAALEHEASHAARVTARGGRAKIKASAVPDSILFVRQTIQGKEFEVGDVVLNAGADTDVRTHGVLFPGADQAHIAVTADRKLGYEVAYANPDDPFRWQHLKEIVDSGHVDIAAVGPTDSFSVKEVGGGVEKIVTRSLVELSLTAGGITLPRLAAQKAADPNAKVYIASPDNSRDKIYYDSSGGSGRGMLGSNSLAHELFGHLWLSSKGVPWQHGGQIAGGIQDPMGRPYTGSVNEYIGHYAGESGTALQSPTQGVSPSLQADVLSWFIHSGAAGLTRLPGNKFKVSDEFGQRWERLSGNYSVLKFKHESDPAVPSTMANVVTTAAGMRTWVASWFGGLNADQKWVFKSFLSALTVGWSAPQGRRTELAMDVGPTL